MEMIQEGTRIAQHEAVRRAVIHARNGEYLTFRLGAEEYGIDILRVQEVKGWTPVTRMPQLPDFVPGVLNLRGSIVPVVDLRARFGLTTIAIKHVSKDGLVTATNIAPGPDDVIQSGDLLSLLGGHERLGQLDATLKRAAKS